VLWDNGEIIGSGVQSFANMDLPVGKMPSKIDGRWIAIIHKTREIDGTTKTSIDLSRMPTNRRTNRTVCKENQRKKIIANPYKTLFRLSLSLRHSISILSKSNN
jgi:hypothetical protein